MKSLNWPPNLTIKKHARARHVKLKASRSYGLELIVPLNFNQENLNLILEQNKTWIENELLKLKTKYETYDVLPNEINFRMLNETWKINYINCKNKLKIIKRPAMELILLGDIENKNLCKKKLLMWVKQYAKKVLPLKLFEISKEINLSFKVITIRDQTTRWGSCSANKSINLNYKLIFISSELSRYVMIHELCHTIHMNHSKNFWKLVEKFDPNWKQNRVKLKKIEHIIPAWI